MVETATNEGNQGTVCKLQSSDKRYKYIYSVCALFSHQCFVHHEVSDEDKPLCHPSGAFCLPSCRSASPPSCCSCRACGQSQPLVRHPRLHPRLAGMQYLIDPYQIQVDRWSAIHNFINYLVHGRYPYMAPTHLGGYGSPFPVWQFLHIPFYYLNNVGLSLLRS